MDEFENLLKTNAPEAQQLARELRELLGRLVPQAKEKIYPGWGVADFQLRGQRDFLSIGPQKKYVNLYFMRGSELPDPAGLLEGSGKSMRHVKIKSHEDLQNPALKALVETASRL
jgi:hypothetical protein